MARFATGDVVPVRVMFGDESGSKVRPAVILAAWQHRSDWDYLLAPITSRIPAEGSGISLHAEDYAAGRLTLTSYARPNYLFTKTETSIGPVQGRLAVAKLNEIIRGARALLREPPE